MNNSHTKYKDLFQTLESGIIFRNPKGKIFSVNRAAEKILGITAEDLIKKSQAFRQLNFYGEDLEILSEEQLPGMQALNTNKIIKNTILCIEIPELKKHLWVSATATPICKGNKKKPKYSITSFIDITKQKNHELKLENQINTLTNPEIEIDSTSFLDLFEIDKIQKLQDDFSNTMGIASMITLPDGTPITEPSNFTHLCKNLIRTTEIGRRNCMKSDNELGRSYIDGPTIKPCLSCGLLDAGAGIFIGNKTKNGDYTFDDVSISPVKDKNGQIICFASVKRNMTESLILEKERNRIKEQLFQSQKMESVGQLASGIAHDFNNILSGIMSASQLLLNPKRNLDEKSQKYVNMILSSGERAADMTSRLLRFSKKSKASFERIQLDLVIDETVKLLKHMIKKSISIDYSVIGESFISEGNASSIQSVLLNLCINSNHAIESNGQITIELSEKFLDQTYCDQSSFNIFSGTYSLIKISDTGSGIPAENLDMIFDAFFTTKGDGFGTGLGLSSVLTIVKEHNGAIEVESTLGEGTIFSLFFPKK